MVEVGGGERAAGAGGNGRIFQEKALAFVAPEVERAVEVQRGQVGIAVAVEIAPGKLAGGDVEDTSDLEGLVSVIANQKTDAVPTSRSRSPSRSKSATQRPVISSAGSEGRTISLKVPLAF